MSDTDFRKAILGPLLDILTGLFLIGGCVIAGIGSVWFMIETFRTSVAWGIGSLFMPIVGLVFLVRYPARAWKPFAMSLGGVLIIGMGGACYGANHPQLLDDPIAAAQRDGGAATGNGGTSDAINKLNR